MQGVSQFVLPLFTNSYQNNNKEYINVAKSLKDDNSILNYYKKLFKVYKQYKDIVKDGVYTDLVKDLKKLVEA